MIRIHRTSCVRLTAYLMSIGLLIYFLQRSIPEKQTLQRRPIPTSRYQTHPVYEYSSIYRAKVNHSFEAELNNKLLDFERTARASLPIHEQSLKADRVIWQIATPQEAKDWAQWVAQWRNDNLEWQYHLFTSPLVRLFSLFDTIPEISLTLKANPTIRTDLSRYLLLWQYGGFYAEIDTWARMGMRDCKPIMSVVDGKKDISLMIGVDHDEPYLHPEMLEASGWTRGFRFAQYVMWAPKRFDPILRTAVVRTISHAMVPKLEHTHTYPWRPKEKTNLDYMEELSGAGMFTDVVLEALSGSLKEGHKTRDIDAGLEHRVTWRKFRHLSSTLWIEPDQAKLASEDIMRGLAVLPINIWGTGQNHSGSASEDFDDACVTHSSGRQPMSVWQDRIFG